MTRYIDADAIPYTMLYKENWLAGTGYEAQAVWKKDIDAMPTVTPEQHWISCGERYPDMDERVFVYTVYHEYHVWDCMSNRADNYFWEDEEGLYHDKYEVDLWMPLPEPYKEG